MLPSSREFLHAFVHDGTRSVPVLPQAFWAGLGHEGAQDMALSTGTFLVRVREGGENGSETGCVAIGRSQSPFPPEPFCSATAEALSGLQNRPWPCLSVP